jgi:hypothetical protein
MSPRTARQGDEARGAIGMSADKFTPPVWRTPAGETVSCRDKIKVLNENLEEIRALSQEALEDAVLMGCDEAQFRDVLKEISAAIVNPYRKAGN